MARPTLTEDMILAKSGNIKMEDGTIKNMGIREAYEMIDQRRRSNFYDSTSKIETGKKITEEKNTEEPIGDEGDKSNLSPGFIREPSSVVNFSKSEKESLMEVKINDAEHVEDGGKPEGPAKVEPSPENNELQSQPFKRGTVRVLGSRRQTKSGSKSTNKSKGK